MRQNPNPLQLLPWHVVPHSVPTDERSPLLIVQQTAALAFPPISEQALNDPEDAKNGEGQCAPMDEGGAALVDEDGEEGPADGDGACDVALGGGECVCGGGCFEEKEGEEDEDLRPDSCGFDEGVYAEGFEGGEEDEDGCESVVEGEGEVDPEFVVETLAGVMFLDDVVDVTDAATDEEGEDESDNVMLAGPDVHVDTGENGQEGEAPGDAIDDGTLAGGEELVDDVTEQEKVD